MKKIGLVTLNGYFNYGNRLQNYALTKFLEKNGYKVYTIWDKNIKSIIKEKIKINLKFIKKYKRFSNFYDFSKSNIEEISSKELKDKKIDYVVIGSDQTWNFNEIINNKLLLGIGYEDIPTISYSASVGLSYIPNEYQALYKKSLSRLKKISVREKTGKDILMNLLDRKDICVNIDPTLLLNSKDWNYVSKKPENYNGEKYILNYFLGELSNDKKKSIEEFAKKNNCEIINLLDCNSPYFTCGPSEFLFLIKNSFLVCTDSFHACVFSFIYDIPFVVFDRYEKNVGNMGSRIDMLLSQFKLENRRYNSKEITRENINHNYSKSYKILEKEKKESKKYFEVLISKDEENEKK